MQSMTASPSQSLNDSFPEEELESSQPLVINTTPVDVHTNTEYLEGEETLSIQEFLTSGCGCDLGDGSSSKGNGSCSKGFTAEYIKDFRSQCSELTKTELDMALLGQLAAFTNTSSHSVHSTKHRHQPASRQRSYMLYWHSGK